MSTLGDLVRSRTDLSRHELEHLQRLVADWQFVSDLSFADLVLWVRSHEGSWLATAHMRPTTGPTAFPLDVVGSERPHDASLDRAWSHGVLVREPEQASTRREALPVRCRGRTVAVLSRVTDLAAARVPSQLELAYLTSAGELVQMISEGTFPFPGEVPDPEHSPRVGDGLVRTDRTGHVVYASPNALSAARRLGLSGDLLGAHLGHTIARLAASPGRLDEPRGSAALAAALRFREPRESEVEAQGTVVMLRALPMLPGGEPRGLLVLLRDVTEVRRRDRTILGKDATIREIHHRVKNNLQTVAALLRMQSRRMTDPAAAAALQESVRRVAAIAVVHETLSLSLEERVEFDEVADKVLAMCSEVSSPMSGVGAEPPQVRRAGSFGVLGAETATALSMVLTELVQNALEHGYDEGERAVIDVTVQRDEEVGLLAVEVRDHGKGLPEGFDLQGSTRLGLQIVRTLVNSELHGTLRLLDRPGGGVVACLEVPLAELEPSGQPQDAGTSA